MSAFDRNLANLACVSSDESVADSELHVAQAFWGQGNLSPLDHLFGSTAIMKLVPKLSVGVVSIQLGRRLARYAEDKGLWTDAYEVDSRLSRLSKKKNTPIRLHDWKPDESLLRKSRYTFLIATQMSEVCPDLGTVYRQCAFGLKSDGKLLAGDLIWADGTGEKLRSAVSKPLKSLESHYEAIRAAGLRVTQTINVTPELLANVRECFQEIPKFAREVTQLTNPIRSQRRLAVLTQLDMWASIYALAQNGSLNAMVFLCTKA